MGDSADPSLADLCRLGDQGMVRCGDMWRPGVDMGWLQAVELPKTGHISCFGLELSDFQMIRCDFRS